MYFDECLLGICNLRIGVSQRSEEECELINDLLQFVDDSSQCLAQCLKYSKCSVNNFWLKRHKCEYSIFW